MIKNIVFDMGNVILRWDPQYIAGKLSNNEKEKEIIINELFASKQWALLDEGKISLEEIVASFKLEHRELLKYALYHWHDYFEPFTEIIPLLKRLKTNNYRIYLLSNCSKQFDEYCCRVEAFKYFDGFYISAKHQLMKPDVKIYQDFLNDFHLQAEESIFIDDVKANIDGAKQAGMAGYCYDGNVCKLEKYLIDEMKLDF